MDVVFSREARLGLRMATGGNLPGCRGREDIFCFDECLSMGDISGDCLGPAREAFMRWYCGGDPELADLAVRRIGENRQKLEELLRRAEAGETLRLWCSLQPDDVCGACWLMDQLKRRTDSPVRVTVVRLPEFEPRGENISSSDSWGDVPVRTILDRAATAEEIPAPAITAASLRWRMLQEENGVLRAVVNGNLITVPEKFYDPFLERQMERMPREEFTEAELIGETLGRNRLNIGDRWLSRRVDRLIDRGKLLVVSTPEKPRPAYRRVLKRS